MFLLSAPAGAAVFDTVSFGDAASETAHRFAAGGSYATTGLYGVACRRIRRPEPEAWLSPAFSFTVKANPKGPIYLTFTWSGDDVTHDHLLMTVDGRMLGQMHLGEYDLLDYEQCYPRDADPATSDSQYPGRFTTTTFLLPETVAREKSELTVAVRAVGHVWGYGTNFKQFQKTIRNDSRGIYAVTVHDLPACPPARTLLAKVKIPASPAPDRSVDMDAVIAKVERGIERCQMDGFLSSHPDRIRFLSRAWRTPGWSATGNEGALDAVVAAVDACADRFSRNPDDIVPDGTWTGACEWARGVVILGEKALASRLDGTISVNGVQTVRRIAWSAVFRASVEALMAHRRFFANQGQIVDGAAHVCNRAWHIVDPAAPVPLETTLAHVKESMGLKPCPNGYVALTPKGLSKEMGYVGSYGESTIWAAWNAWECSFDFDSGAGDAELLAQMKKACEARLPFRFPTCRRDGTPVLRLESYVSWRNEHFPSDPCYAAKGISLRPMLATRSVALLGAVADEMDDGEYARRVRALGRECFDEEFLDFPKNHAKVERMRARAGDRLPHIPMRGGDFVWSDEENAIVALKCGEECLWMNLFYRSHRDVANRLARVHLVTPRFESVATVRCDVEFEPKLKDGKPEMDVEPDFFQYGWQGRCYPEYRDEPDFPPRNALAGAVRPKTVREGRCDFYRCAYGPYLVAVNDSRKGRAFRLDVPKGMWRILPTGKTVRGPVRLDVPPGTTRILRTMR